MKTQIIVTLALFACVALSVPALAQDESEMPAMTPEQQAEMMEWMKLASPGEHHKHLEPFVGSWCSAQLFCPNF